MPGVESLIQLKVSPSKNVARSLRSTVAADDPTWTSSMRHVLRRKNVHCRSEYGQQGKRTLIIKLPDFQERPGLRVVVSNHEFMIEGCHQQTSGSSHLCFPPCSIKRESSNPEYKPDHHSPGCREVRARFADRFAVHRNSDGADRLRRAFKSRALPQTSKFD